MIKLIAGIKSKDYETRNAFVNILSSCLTAIANKYPEFQNAGMQCMIKFIAGIKEKAEEVKTAFTGNLNASVTAIRDYYDQFKQAGAYLVEGFADGISENTYRAEAKARAMARAAAEAAEDELDEHSPSRVGYHIGDFFGLGFVNAIGTYAVKAYNASLFNSSRMPSRNIVISLAYMWKDSIEDVRQLSYKYFPIKKKLTMLIETDNRQAEIEGYVESNDPTIFSKDESSDISIVCPNPFFYSAGKDGLNTTIFYGVEALFEFPFSNESLQDPLLEMGEIKNETEQVVAYNGDAEIGVTITIHAIGEASNITIYNTGTREVMRIDTDKLEKFTGSGIIAGDEIIICTVKGNKSITLLRNGKTTNILNCLDKNADWFQLAKGDNIFAYTAEYGSTNLQFKIENRIVYEGV